MPFKKKAKILTSKQFNIALKACDDTKYPLKNRIMLLLSFKAGLRASEISNLKWEHLTDPEGNLTDHISLDNANTKGKKSGRRVPVHPMLKEALIELYDVHKEQYIPSYVIRSERSHRMQPGSVTVWFHNFFKAIGLDGCSSHSGRRTFITNAAKNIIGAGGTLNDVKTLAGHKYLNTTAEYMDESEDAKIKVVNMI